MMSSKVLIIFGVLLMNCFAAPQGSDLNLSSLAGYQFNQIFKNNSCSPGFKCTPYHLCQESYGSGTVDININIFQKKCPPSEKCCVDLKKFNGPTAEPRKTLSCGNRNPNGIGFQLSEGRIHEAEYAEFPWMVAVLGEESSTGNLQMICAGSLIHPKVILTAAHCFVVSRSENIIVRAGEWDLASISEIYNTQQRYVNKIIIHNNFRKDGFYNDAALLFVSQPFNLHESVGTICLPQHADDYDTSNCYVSGWGSNMVSYGNYASVLKKSKVSVGYRTPFEIIMRSTRLGKDFELHKSFICALAERGDDGCSGDGGSPLVCPIRGTKNRFYQIGINSWGTGCFEGVPRVYAFIPIIKPWIDEQLQKYRIDLS